MTANSIEYCKGRFITVLSHKTHWTLVQDLWGFCGKEFKVHMNGSDVLEIYDT